MGQSIMAHEVFFKQLQVRYRRVKWPRALRHYRNNSYATQRNGLSKAVTAQLVMAQGTMGSRRLGWHGERRAAVVLCSHCAALRATCVVFVALHWRACESVDSAVVASAKTTALWFAQSSGISTFDEHTSQWFVGVAPPTVQVAQGYSPTVGQLGMLTLL